jgi:DNA-binding MarR family transcriptional regulator
VGLNNAQFDVLAHVGAVEGMTQQELADSILVTKGNVALLLDRVEGRG